MTKGEVEQQTGGVRACDGMFGEMDLEPVLGV